MNPKRTYARRWLIGAILLVLPIVGAAAATAASRTGPRPSCSEAIGARWHIRHFFFQYGSHGAVLPGESSRLPASGNRYIVTAGGKYCALAHKSMRRLTAAIPDRALTGRMVDNVFVPPGYGYLFQSPHGYICAATMDEKQPPEEKGDNRHLGFCAKLSSSGRHTFAFIWTAATGNPGEVQAPVTQSLHRSGAW
jgi:hypothetical protein